MARGVSNRERSTPISNLSRHVSSLFEAANTIFTDCCRKNAIPEQCIPACNYDSYNNQLINSMILGSSQCTVTTLPVIHSCASRGHDHGDCCARAGIPAQCINYCVPRKRTILGGPWFSCLRYFEEMKGCFISEASNKSEETKSQPTEDLVPFLGFI
ncbi:hypothetical protein RB195_010531 [Necator americanus]|uniref:Domain of unknown function DB domain-containing protein n=1 Tax=Necator americanus TaxID=51031 RepID=A0ABR1CYC7_NECAM